MKKRKQGLAGIGFGIIMVIVCTVLLFQNEGRAVDRYKALGEIEQAVEVDSDDTLEDNGTMVLIADVVTGAPDILDAQLGVRAPADSIKLIRSVEMFQWEESSDSDGGSDAYTYAKVWSDVLIDSSDFNNRYYDNPTVMLYESTTLTAEQVSIGAYDIDEVFIRKMNDGKALTGLEEMSLIQEADVIGDKIFISENEGSTLEQPMVGDYMIKYSYVPSQKYTLLGEKQDEELVSYYTKHGDLAEVEPGIMDKETLEARKVADNKGLTFGFRVALIIGMIIANGLILSPLTKLIGYIPLVGKFINGGIKFVSAVVGVIWSLIVIAVGWIFFRSLIGIGLLLAVAGLIYLIIRRNKNNEAVETIN